MISLKRSSSTLLIKDWLRFKHSNIHFLISWDRKTSTGRSRKNTLILNSSISWQPRRKSWKKLVSLYQDGTNDIEHPYLVILGILNFKFWSGFVSYISFKKSIFLKDDYKSYILSILDFFRITGFRPSTISSLNYLILKHHRMVHLSAFDQYL